MSKYIPIYKSEEKLSRSDTMKNEYFNYLIGVVGIDKTTQLPDTQTYFSLLKQLHKKDFYYTLDRDYNRANDGEKLRYGDFKEEGQYTDDDISFLSGPASVLEMMVALSVKASDIMWSDDSDAGAGKWFWVFIENLGLDQYTDQEYIDKPDSLYDVDDILEKFMSRKYKRNGSDGSMFPMRMSKKDMRNMELWYQMNEWLNYNYNLPQTVFS